MTDTGQRSDEKWANRAFEEAVRLVATNTTLDPPTARVRLIETYREMEPDFEYKNIALHRAVDRLLEEYAPTAEDAQRVRETVPWYRRLLGLQ